MVEFEFIETPQQLIKATNELTNCSELAIDIECENNLHHYGVFISLIQISSRNKNWIIDVLALKDIKPLVAILENNSILKVFHDVGFDFRILNHQFSCNPKNVFDTQIAAAFLGSEHLGLGSLLDEEFGFKKEKKFQRVDWTRRPLSYAMLQYAVQDTSYLLPLKDRLMKKIHDKGRTQWINEEMQDLEKRDFTLHEQEYKDFSGFRSLLPHEKVILHVLFDERNALAKRVDKPTFMICNNQLLLDLAKNPPNSINDWKNLHGVNPIIRTEAERLFNLIEDAKQKPAEELVFEKRERMSIEQGEVLKQLLELRQVIAQPLGIKGHLLMDQDQAREIILSKTLNSLRDWQQELFKNQPFVQKILK